MSERNKSVLTFLVSLVLLSAGWEAISRAGLVNPLVLPPPSAIAGSLWNYVINLFSPISYWTDTWITFYEIVLGYALGVGGALVLGTLVAEFATVRRTVIPYMVALNATPKIALAPLFVVWFGFGAAPKVIMSAFICFFPVLINTITGLSAAAEDELELMASLRASRWETFRRLKLFTALPYIFAALRTAMAFAVVGAIIGEFAGARTRPRIPDRVLRRPTRNSQPVRIPGRAVAHGLRPLRHRRVGGTPGGLLDRSAAFHRGQRPHVSNRLGCDRPTRSPRLDARHHGRYSRSIEAIAE